MIYQKKEVIFLLTLRPFEERDAETVLSWFEDERAFRKWSADRYGAYPATAGDMLDLYRKTAAECESHPMTAVDESGKTVGHILIRKLDADNVRFGFIALDGAIRGKGYGRELVSLAAGYAFGELGAKRITLGVFDNNEPAKKCYASVGFRCFDTTHFDILGENWQGNELELFKQN